MRQNNWLSTTQAPGNLNAPFLEKAVSPFSTRSHDVLALVGFVLAVMIFDEIYSKSLHIRTYQNKNLEAVFPKLCTLQIRTCFSLMKHRFLLQGLQNLSLIAAIKVIAVPVGFESFIFLPNYLLCL